MPRAVEPRQHRQTLLLRLAEADAGIEHDAVARNAGALGDTERAGEEPVDVGHDVDRRIGALAVVHDDDRHGVPGHDAGHVGIALQTPHVVDDAGARRERQLRDRAFMVSIDTAPRARHRGQHRLEPPRFLASARPAPRRHRDGWTPPDIDDVGALRHHAPGLGDGGLRVEKRPPSENESGVTLRIPITTGRRRRAAGRASRDASPSARGRLGNEGPVKLMPVALRRPGPGSQALQAARNFRLKAVPPNR